jgi:acyl-CoA reductase-like NAD-dependent aldehyde dehydrogenase
MQLSSPHLSERATALLAGTGTYAGGTWRDAAGPVLDVIDPSDGQVVGRLATSTADDVRTAVSAARSAFDDGSWSGLSPAQRSAALHRLTDVLSTATRWWK